MKYEARMIVSYYTGGAQNAYFETVDAGKQALNDLATALGRIKEFGNRDEDPVFRYSGAGAFYAVDLRKVAGASLEIKEQWAEVQKESHMHYLACHKAEQAAADERGLRAEFDRLSEPRTSGDMNGVGFR